MKHTTYFAKHGRIFGLSSKCEFGTWNHTLYLFTDLSAAEDESAEYGVYDS